MYKARLTPMSDQRRCYHEFKNCRRQFGLA